jgi:glycosyltransferase involved in cell wall biosynthesis
MQKPVISIIGTIYNQSKLAERTLDIWCRQNFDLPYEIIVLDDGSTDETRAMISGLQEKHPNLIRYFYFDEPDLARNCTLLFNTAIKRLMRSDLALIQMYDRIPSTLNALKYLYEPHSKEDRISVTFQSRHIAGSSSHDLLDEKELDRLMDTVPWRQDPMELTKIMGTPGTHCYPDTMNESPCFSIKKQHLEEINGYDERYFKVANYSNVELWGRLKRAGIKMLILDHYTFHQPHTSNRSDIQRLIEPDTLIKRNTRIRKEWGTILPQSMVSEDLFPLTIVVQRECERKECIKRFSHVFDIEVIAEPDWNKALQKARGQIVVFFSACSTGMTAQELEKAMSIYKAEPKTGCIGQKGGDISNNNGLVHVGLKKGSVEVAMGSFLAFPRKRAIANGLSFMEESNPQIRFIDFSRQMTVWGGRKNVSLTADSVACTAKCYQFNQRWDFLSKS